MGQATLEEEYVDHPRVQPEALEARTYQQVIAAEATAENTICVLPTGLGKTAVGILLAAHRLEQEPNGKVLMLAPTRPLVEQHRDAFKRALKVDTDVFEVLTGDTRPEKRAAVWKEIGAFFATPQVVENDIINDRLDLDEFALVIFDEVHRATGDYPYNFVAEQYLERAADPHILGLTASPGSDREQIEDVAERLGIDRFEVRTEEDADVAPYVQETETHWVEVELDKHFRRVKRALDAAERTFLKQLKSAGFIDSLDVQKKDLLQLRGELGSRMNEEDDPALYQAMSDVAACMKVEHALELLETQGATPLYRFLEKMEKDPGSKAAKRLLDDEDFANAMAVAEWMVNNGKEHPKLTELAELVREKLTQGETAIVFTQYRDTVDLIAETLNGIAHVEAETFKGQADGVTQQDQLETLDRFRDDDFNVLVSTSVGEEGLDVPAVDYVFFYEPIPSEIRTIQRRGRTGRQEQGDVYVLMASDTRDEAYYWSAKHKEERMQETMQALKAEQDDTDAAPSGVPDVADARDDTDDEASGGEGQATLDGFAGDDELVVYADDRENTVLKALTRRDGVAGRSTRLEVGDFVVSDRAVVERKTAEDFVSSIVDGRLFEQVRAMHDAYERPVLIIEGEDLYRHRDVHPNAIRGALASLTVDFDLPILWSGDEDETVDLLVALARREQEEQDRSVALRGERSPTTERELQAFIVSGLPNVSDTLAERLLEEFGTVEAVLTASETALQDVEGIGAEKAKRIREILTRRYDD